MGIDALRVQNRCKFPVLPSEISCSSSATGFAQENLFCVLHPQISCVIFRCTILSRI